MAERGRLLGDLHNTLAKVEKLKATVAEHNKDREKIVRTKAEWMNEMRLHQKRMTLLRLYTSQVSSGTSKIKEISQKVGRRGRIMAHLMIMITPKTKVDKLGLSSAKLWVKL